MEWRHGIFSDEKKLNLDEPDGFRHYYHDLRKDPRFKFSRNFDGESIIFWAGFLARGKTMVAKIG